MAELINPVPDTSKAGWKFDQQTDATGKPTRISAHQERLGVDITYGQGPDGYDQFAIREPNGGGSVIVPYVVIEGQLYIGAIQQRRRFAGGFITQVSRGFTMPQESHDDAARREFQEETGVNESLAQRVYGLKGRPVNPNDTYFVANPHKNEGVRLFGLPVKADEVELRRASSDARLKVYKLKPELQGQIKEMSERINPAGIRFFHVDLLRNTSDMFTQAAIAKILTTK